MNCSYPSTPIDPSRSGPHCQRVVRATFSFSRFVPARLARHRDFFIFRGLFCTSSMISSRGRIGISVAFADRPRWISPSPATRACARFQDASFEAPTPMPILSADPTQFPDGLLTDPEVMETQAGRWWAVYTRAKAEKALARHLYCQGVSYYLPLKATLGERAAGLSALCYLCFRAMCSCRRRG